MIARTPSIRRNDPPLADTMRLMMPCASTTLLLQAALLPGEAAGRAWSQWWQTVPDPKAFLASDRVGIKRHLPLLYRNLTVYDIEMGRDLAPYFRAARAREELRSVRYRRFLGEALGALAQAGIDFVVGKGVTVGETIHTDPVVRHNHDIDLLVRPGDILAAAHALQQAGFHSASDSGICLLNSCTIKLNHDSGLPVELHSTLYRTPFYDGGLAGIWRRARNGEVVAVPVRLIGDADLLVHAMVHASVVPQRRGLSWIVDVVSLLRQRESQGRAIDWTEVLRIGRASHAMLPLYVTCDYLAKTFAAPIPQDVMNELRRDADGAGPLQHLAALDGLRAEPRNRRIKSVLDSSGWRSRAAIARAMLLPPLAYFEAIHPEMGTLALAMQYFARPIRFAARQCRRIPNRLRRPRTAIARTIGAILPRISAQPQGDH